ncbi:MAG: hypothetical protein V4696_03575 [Pseudomonadota bacterium]
MAEFESAPVGTMARLAALEAALTPSDDTKAAYMNRFRFVFGEFTPNVPWTCLTRIMAAIKARADGE